MAQCRRASTTLVKTQVRIPAHGGSQPPVSLIPGNPMPSLISAGTRHTSSVQMYIQASGVQDELHLHKEFEASLGYLRPSQARKRRLEGRG